MLPVHETEVIPFWLFCSRALSRSKSLSQKFSVTLPLRRSTCLFTLPLLPADQATPIARAAGTMSNSR